MAKLPGVSQPLASKPGISLRDTIILFYQHFKEYTKKKKLDDKLFLQFFLFF
jgi:hypothetical protein